MQINPYLAFDGNCEEAFKVYHSVLGGHISALYRIGDSPMHAELPKESHNRIMHIRLDVANIGLMGGDSPMGQHAAPQGICVSLNVDTVAEAERIYNALSKEGVITMPLAETFWAQAFAMFSDKFGTPWMINCEAKQDAK